MTIWLQTNLSAHNFIPENYWKGHFDDVKMMLPDADVYVYKINEKVVGFIGLSDNYIAGLFVDRKYQSQGIGRALLKYVKNLRMYLSLNVYKKNFRAIRFYQREEFIIISESLDEDTNEMNISMIWHK